MELKQKATHPVSRGGRLLGSSRAAFPNGTGQVKKIPLMNDLVGILRLRPLIRQAGKGLGNESDFEAIYSKLAYLSNASIDLKNCPVCSASMKECSCNPRASAGCSANIVAENLRVNLLWSQPHNHPSAINHRLISLLVGLRGYLFVNRPFILGPGSGSLQFLENPHFVQFVSVQSRPSMRLELK